MYSPQFVKDEGNKVTRENVINHFKNKYPNCDIKLYERHRNDVPRPGYYVWLEIDKTVYMSAQSFEQLRFKLFYNF